MMSLHPKHIDLTLDRMWRCLEALGNPQEKIPPVIHVAGTNGKGSTQAMLRAGIEGVFQTAHAYTSPHLVRFHERIRLAGRIIGEDQLAALLDEVYEANGGDPITYFEITTAAAFLAFSQIQADWTLLEVGLGGRLDATNVIGKPRLSIITPISYDHQQFLGETLGEIASEKAGIIKKGVPVVVAPQKEESLDVIEDAIARAGAPAMIAGQHWHARAEGGRLIVEDETGLVDLPMPNLRGPHQIVNAGTAVVGLRHLGFVGPAADAAVSEADWPARMQRLKAGPLTELAPGAEIWLDGGHNPAAGEAMVSVLADLPPRKTVMVCGMLKTKDVEGYLRHLKGSVETLHAVTIPGVEATLTAEDTASAAEAVGIPARRADDVETAIADIVADNPDSRILIGGSLYLAGAVLRENG
ncbi:MAG: folylpolyglutamate synthase/dihydrofolate synthase family protein [Pseudomonadota bacterium]